MHPPLLFTLDGNAGLRAGLLRALRLAEVECVVRRFPDGESYVRILAECQGRDVLVLCSLAEPDLHIIPLQFLADTARELGARSVGLVAPYLAYMRQDTRFAPGEAVSARLFAGLLSRHFDWLVTVDPHLHRFHRLDEVYPGPHRVVHAAPLLAEFIRAQVAEPLLIGPDSESEQWVAAVAALAGAPYQVLHKERRGDREVVVSVPETAPWREHTPVLVDDIIATGHTLIETVSQLRVAGLKPPVCLAVHGLFVEQAHARLLAAGAGRVATTNSLVHASNAIDLSPLLAEAVADLLPTARRETGEETP